MFNVVNFPKCWKTAKVRVPKGWRVALALGWLPSHMIMHIISDLKWGAEVQMQADAFRDTCPCPMSLCSSAEKQIMSRYGLIFHLRVIAEGYVHWTAI